MFVGAFGKGDQGAAGPQSLMLSTARDKYLYVPANS
jgi:hypothetical protein